MNIIDLEGKTLHLTGRHEPVDILVSSGYIIFGDTHINISFISHTYVHPRDVRLLFNPSDLVVDDIVINSILWEKRCVAHKGWHPSENPQLMVDLSGRSDTGYDPNNYQI